jgi:transcriptional regulator with XRE-family HTH domain
MSLHTQFLMDAMASKDKPFFVELGKRIAHCRREQNMTQQQLADVLGLSQQTLAHYEVARLRAPASLLPTLSDIFKVPLDELMGHAPAPARSGKRGPPSQLERSMERIGELPKAKQKFVLEMLETVLAQSNG